MNEPLPTAPVSPITEPPHADRRVASVRFTASGSEYFRIWSVNTLLTFLTLGLYLPFAKARSLRYFYANTLVDGDALAFHGDPWRMFRGYVVMLLLFALYAGASWVSDVAALGAFLAASLAWPALWRSSLMFRLGNTSWRGLRFGFEGSLSGAYRSQALLFLPALIGVLGTTLAAGGITPGDAATEKRAEALMAMASGLAFIVAIVVLPVGLAWVKRYQHGGYRYAREAARFTAPTVAFYKLALRLLLLVLGLVVAAGLLVGSWVLLAYVLHGKAEQVVAALLAVVAALAYVAAFTVVSACGAAWLQNLVWNATESQGLRFTSTLRARPLAVLSLKNLLLVVLTLGLYRPFAVVNVMRMRLEATSVSLPADVGDWLAGAPPQTGSGRGEMAGDFFGVDVGL